MGRAAGEGGSDELDGKDSAAFFTGATYRNTNSAMGVLAPVTNQSYVQCDGPEDCALGGRYSGIAEGTHIVESSPYVAPEAAVEGWEFRWLDNNATTDEWVMEVAAPTSRRYTRPSRAGWFAGREPRAVYQGLPLIGTS